MPLRTVIACLLAAGAAAWAPAAVAPPKPVVATNRPAAAVRLAPAAEPAPPALAWQDDLETALLSAAAEYRPVLLFATLPDCVHCERMRRLVFTDEKVLAALRDFALVEIDLARQAALARELRIGGAPTMIFLSSEGRELGRLTGFVPADSFRAALAAVLDRRAPEAGDAGAREALAALDAGRVPADRWPDLLIALGADGGRRDVAEKIRALDPFPRTNLVALLESPRLAVRLGALEALETAAGDTFGFDPWGGAPERAASPGLARWRSWADMAATNPPAAFSALTREAIAGYLQDIVSDHRDRSRRAMRMLTQGGAPAAQMLDEYAAAHPDLPAGTVQRIREARFAALLPARIGFDPAAAAHRLVFGNLDMQLQTLRELSAAGPAALPVATAHLGHANPLVRETAVETLIGLAGRDAIPRLEELMATEKDREVIIAMANGLGALKSKRGLAMLTGLLQHADEDVVIAALQSIARLRSRTPAAELAASLQDPRWRVRVAALQAVGSLKLKDLGGDVEKLVADSEPFVRYNAVVVLPLLLDKEAAPRLEKVFLADDELKGPVAAAFCSMRTPLPASFIAALQDKPPPVLLAVLDGLSKCEQSGLGLAAELARHTDADVACAALRLLAEHGMELPKHRALVLEALQGASRDKRLAALQSMSVQRRDTSFAVTFNLPAAPATGAVSGAVADLLDAFGEAAPAAPKAIPAPAVGLGDLLDAFGAAPGAPAAAGAASGRYEDLQAVLNRLAGDNADPEVQRLASIQLVQLGQTEPLAALARQKKELTSDTRYTIAYALRNSRRAESLAYLRDQLADPAAQVREAAAESMAGNVDLAPWCDALFAELLRPGTPLQPRDVYDWSFRNALEKPSGRTNVRRWVEKLIAQTGRADLVSLGAVLVETGWRKGDDQLLAPLASNDNPYVRRAALHALGTRDTANGPQWLALCATDPAEVVRLIVPAVLNREDHNWLHYFDEKQFESSAWISSSSSRPRLKDADREALRKLTGDPSVRVRVESYLALLAGGEDVDAAGLRAAVESVADKTAVGRRVADFLTSNVNKLGKRHAALIPLLDYGNLEDERKEQIISQINGPAAEAPASSTNAPARVAASPAPAAPAAAAPAPAPAAPAAAAQAIRLVFFSEPGCESCARVRDLLTILRESLAELRVEEHPIHTVDARRLNDELCDRFHAPERVRGLTPVVFTAAGFLTGEEITLDRLADLAVRSLGQPFDLAAPAPPVAAADATAPAPSAAPRKAPNWRTLGLALGAAIVLVALYLLARRRGSKE